MRRAAYFLGAAAVLAVAAWLRFDGLGDPPMQADEATGARFAAQILEGPAPRFDPSHFHGPVLWLAGASAARAAGEDGWTELTASTLRSIPASAGLLVVGLALASFPLVGRRASLLAAAFLAVSPVAVHYSRIFVHEPLLAAALAGALLSSAVWWNRPSWWPAAACGAFLGLAAATKESFVLVPASWAVAALVLKLRPAVTGRRLAASAGAFLVVACAVFALFQTSLFADPEALPRYAATYWSYQLGDGHEKPPGYYAALLLAPSFHGRLVWWFGAPFLLAASAFFAPSPGRARTAAKFLVIAAVVHLAVLSLLPYKTPWLLLGPSLELSAAAGFSLAAWMAAGRVSWMVAAVAGLALLVDARQARLASRDFPSDPRNPLCYVPTVTGIADWTQRLSRWLEMRGTASAAVAVVGPGYWPLPWYLRDHGPVGYWSRIEDAPSDAPVVVAMPEVAAEAARVLAETHRSIFEGVRNDTPVVVFIRADVWRRAVEESP
jgi:uncharacterized protein (TIGR03663 family)